MDVHFHYYGSFYWLCFCTADREEFTKTEDDGHRYGWFEEIEMPQESEMEGIPYLGPQIDESIS